jgi:hypothetical protein
MRKWMWLAALGLGLVGGKAAQAQQALTFGPVVGPLQYKLVTDRNKLPIGGTFLRSNSFTLSSLFPNISRLTGRPTPATMTFPTQDQLPGMSYLSNFGYHIAQPAK